MDRGHLRGISETSVSTIGGAGAYVTPQASPGLPTPNSPYGPDSYSQIRERERSVGRGEGEGDGILRQDGGRPSLVSPLSPPGGRDGEDYLSARGSVSGPALTPPAPEGVSPTGQTRRKSNFQESLD